MMWFIDFSKTKQNIKQIRVPVSVLTGISKDFVTISEIYKTFPF